MLNLLDFAHILREQRFIHVAQIGDFAVRPCREFFGMIAAATVNADNGKSHAIACRLGFQRVARVAKEAMPKATPALVFPVDSRNSLRVSLSIFRVSK